MKTSSYRSLRWTDAGGVKEFALWDMTDYHLKNLDKTSHQVCHAPQRTMVVNAMNLIAILYQGSSESGLTDIPMNSWAVQCVPELEDTNSLITLQSKLSLWGCQHLLHILRPPLRLLGCSAEQKQPWCMDGTLDAEEENVWKPQKADQKALEKHLCHSLYNSGSLSMQWCIFLRSSETKKMVKWPSDRGGVIYCGPPCGLLSLECWWITELLNKCFYPVNTHLLMNRTMNTVLYNYNLHLLNGKGSASLQSLPGCRRQQWQGHLLS